MRATFDRPFVRVRGVSETSAALRDLAKFVAVPLNAASRFALRPTVAAAKRNVRKLPLKEITGTLAASLTIRHLTRTSKINPRHRVGPPADYERNTKYGVRKPVKYAHLLEFGTANGAAPHPFMTPAYYETRNEVVKRFGERIGPEMEKRAAKLNRKVKR